MMPPEVANTPLEISGVFCVRWDPVRPANIAAASFSIWRTAEASEGSASATGAATSGPYVASMIGMPDNVVAARACVRVQAVSRAVSGRPGRPKAQRASAEAQAQLPPHTARPSKPGLPPGPSPAG
jgi:hypothetical protein